ncbi:MAG: hypothetical protein ABGX06_03580, partial [Candidatus Poseidoniia archaeon]
MHSRRLPHLDIQVNRLLLEAPRHSTHRARTRSRAGFGGRYRIWLVGRPAGVITWQLEVHAR